MKALKLSVFEVLNESIALVRRIAAPWLGVTWLLCMPLRMMQVFWLQELFVLHSNARHYGDYLRQLSFYLIVTFTIGIYGRAVFVRACNLATLGGRMPGMDALRVPLKDFGVHMFLALLIEVLFFMFLMTFITTPYFIILGGLVAAIAYNQPSPGVIGPLKDVLRFAGNIRALLGLGAIFAGALFILWVNLYVAAIILVWLSGGVAGLDVSAWEQLLRPSEYIQIVPAEFLPRMLLLFAAGLVLEPFWIASHVVLVRSLRTRQSGEDLKQWFEEIRREAA